LLLLLQVKKDEKELTVGWGAGPTFDLPKRGPQLDADGKQVGCGACSSGNNTILSVVD
jgi:hypothetical protein